MYTYIFIYIYTYIYIYFTVENKEFEANLCCTGLSESFNNAQSPYGFCICGLPPRRGQNVLSGGSHQTHQCRSGICLSRVSFPLPFWGSGGFPQPPEAKLFCAPPLSLLALHRIFLKKQLSKNHHFWSILSRPIFIFFG